MVVAVVVTAFLGMVVVIIVRVLKSSVYCVVVVGVVGVVVLVAVGKTRATTTAIDTNITANATNKAMKYINKSILLNHNCHPNISHHHHQHRHFPTITKIPLQKP